MDEKPEKHERDLIGLTHNQDEYFPALTYRGIDAGGERSLSKVKSPPSDIDAYGYLQGIYQGRWQYEPERARAARDCLPFERPKLAVIAKVGESFAERLEEAIERRLGRPQVTSKLIEAKPVEVKETFKRRV
jgi:hypothetical protein